MTESDNSLWIKVDDDEFRKWDNLENDAFEWYWKEFHFSEGGEERSLPFFLTAGNHTISLAYSSQEFKVDRLAIASEGKLTSSEDPDVIRVFGPMDYEAESMTAQATICNSDQKLTKNLTSMDSNPIIELKPCFDNHFTCLYFDFQRS